MNKDKLKSAIAAFIKNQKANSAYYNDNWTERKERKAYYQSFTKDKLLAMTEEGFLEYVSKLWSMLMWGNKTYVVNCIIKDNGFKKVKESIADLLYGSASIEKRWDIFTKTIKGIGPATMSELLCYINPDDYSIFNKTTILGYSYLDIPDMPKVQLSVYRKEVCRSMCCCKGNIC